MRGRASIVVVGTAWLLSVVGTAQARDLDCEDFANREQAQVVLDANPSDPNNLDADHDGEACEEFDYSSGVAQVTTPPVGAVAAGDGTTSDPEPSALPFVLGGLGLVAAGGAAVAARRTARGSA